MIEQKNGEIVLFGYGNYILEEHAGIAHLDELMRDPDTFIADIRLKPFSSKDFPEWHGFNLKKRYGYNKAGQSRYVWIEELGNLHYRKEDRDKGFALQDAEIGLSRLILGLSFGRRLVVLCGCKHYPSCHRSLVAQLLLAELPNMTVTHVEELERNSMSVVIPEQHKPAPIVAEQVKLFAEPAVWKDI